MDKKTTRFNIVHGDNEYEIPEECEAAEEAAEELAKTNLEEHYSFINLLSIAVIMLFACIFFISVSGIGNSVLDIVSSPIPIELLFSLFAEIFSFMYVI